MRDLRLIPIAVLADTMQIGPDRLRELIEEDDPGTHHLRPHIVRDANDEILGIIQRDHEDTPAPYHEVTPALVRPTAPLTEIKVVKRDVATPTGVELEIYQGTPQCYVIHDDERANYEPMARDEAEALRDALTHLLRLWPEPPEDEDSGFEPDDDLPF